MKNDVLERNLAALLRHAWVPAQPTPAFRRAIVGLLRAEVARRSAGLPTRRATPARRRWRAAALGLAAAAAVVALVALVPRTPEPDLEALLARGDVALRASGQGWRAATADERRDGVRLDAGALQLVTPEDRAALRVALDDGTVSAGAGTQASLVLDGSAVRARLERGALALERDGRTGAWTVTGRDGTLVLERGAASIERGRDGDRVRLDAGVARYEGPGGVRTLAPGDAHTSATEAAESATAAPTAREDAPARSAVEVAPADGTTAPATPSRGAALSGTVADATSGAPLERFDVVLLRARQGNDYQTPRARSFADPSGAFLFEDVPAGRYRVFARAAGRALLDLGLHALEQGRMVELPPALLVAGGSVKGFVVDARTGSAVGGATVLSERDTPSHWLPLDGASTDAHLPTAARTRADGSFTLEHLSPGAHTLRVDAPGHAPVWLAPIEVEDGAQAEVPTVALNEGGSLSGTVTLPDGSPRVGARVIVSPMDQAAHPQLNFAMLVTDPEGRFAVGDLPAENMLVILITEGSSEPPKVRPARIEAGEETVVDFREDLRGVTVRGRLRDARGEAVTGRNIALYPLDDALAGRIDFAATTTLEDGRFRFDDVAPGRYMILRIEDMGVGVLVLDVVVVPPGLEVEHDVTLSGLSLTGTCLDATTGEPLGRHTVIASGYESESGDEIFGMTASGPDGSFRLQDLPAGRYVVVSYPVDGEHGFATSAETSLAPGTPAPPLELLHGPGGSARVRVVDTAGRPVKDAVVVFVERASAQELEFGLENVTDTGGWHEAVGLRPGAYEVRVRKQGYTSGADALVVRTHTTSELTISLAPAGGHEPASTEEGTRR